MAPEVNPTPINLTILFPKIKNIRSRKLRLLCESSRASTRWQPRAKGSRERDCEYAGTSRRSHCARRGVAIHRSVRACRRYRRFPQQQKNQHKTLSLLVSLPNVIVTSHQAFLTHEALANIATTTLKNLDDYFAGAPLENEICYRCLGSGGANKSDCPRRANGRCHSVI